MAENLLSGTCGTCVWEFEPCSIDDPDIFTFYIAPIDSERGGVLDEWRDTDETGEMVPPWYDHPAITCADTVRVKVFTRWRVTGGKK